jgi:predicted MFS family arabinose efflux permease
MAYLSEEVAASSRAVAAGWFVAGTTLGGLSGRILATPVADVLGWRAGMTAVVLLAVLAATGFTLLAPRERRRTPRSAAGGGLRRLLEPLRDPGQLALLACAFLLMGGFVAIYNYLAFHLSGPPYLLPASLIGLMFLAYLGGTVASPLAGRHAAVHGRLPVMLASMLVMLCGLLLTLAPPLPVVLLGLVLMTAGFFGAHSVASGWAGARSAGARSQATGLYNLAYYAGSSVLGWALGLVLESAGWGGVVAVVCAAVVLAGLAALALLRDEHQDPRRT